MAPRRSTRTTHEQPETDSAETPAADAYAADPYEADSDHEYEPLEAERASEDDVIEQAQRFGAVDATTFDDTGDEDVESGAPGRTATRERLEDLNDALEASEDGDPESLSMREARRNAVPPPEELDPPDELQEPLDRMMDRTPVSAEDMDTESAIDATDGFGGREEAR
ncbi:MAG TPA: hypothetical protein VNM91_06710 [Dehalococcoidia bacterium]|nr:hypothetical protein [Dehalococcoidia bacterium]